MNALSNQMSSLSNLVETLEAECTKAFRNDVSFVVNSLKTRVEKLDLIVPNFTLMRAFQSSQSNASLKLSPRGKEAIIDTWPKEVLQEATP